MIVLVMSHLLIFVSTSRINNISSCFNYTNNFLKAISFSQVVLLISINNCISYLYFSRFFFTYMVKELFQSKGYMKYLLILRTLHSALMRAFFMFFCIFFSLFDKQFRSYIVITIRQHIIWLDKSSLIYCHI